MSVIKKKVVYIFSDGSLHYETSVIKNLKKIIFSEIDHQNFKVFRKKTDKQFMKKKIINFKTRFLKTY